MKLSTTLPKGYLALFGSTLEFVPFGKIWPFLLLLKVKTKIHGLRGLKVLI